MNPIKYDDFSFFGDIYYEISKKMMLEKVKPLLIYYYISIEL